MKRSGFYRITILSLVLLIACVTGCSPATATPTRVQPSPTNTPTIQPTFSPEPATPMPTETIPTSLPTTAEPTAEKEEWIADGAIGTQEYPHETTIGPVRVFWHNDDMSLYLALEAETEGWVSIGLDPVDRMEGANYVIAAVDNSELFIQDEYGTAPTGRGHSLDTELGGTDDIVTAAGKETDGITTVECQLPLDSGDMYDKPLTPGQSYTIIVATGSSDDLTQRHNYRGSGSITLDP